MSTSNSSSQIGYVQLETPAYGTIPNSTGTATLANADAFRLISLETSAETGLLDRPSKTASLSRTVGILGKKGGTWRTTVELAGSGAAGTAPDIDPFLQAFFGAAPTISSGVSVSYALADASPSLAIWNFRDPSTMEQLVALGAIVSQASIDITQERSTMELSGPCRYVTPSEGFAGLDSTAKGGLTAFPARPSSPTYAGTMALGLYGSSTLDGSAYTTLRSLRINIDTARSLIDNVLFNGAYAGSPQQGIRNVTVDFELTDEDTVANESLKAKARAKTSMDLVFVVGATAGNIWTITLNDVQLTSPGYDDSQPSWGARFTGVAHASSASATDELTLVLT